MKPLNEIYKKRFFARRNSMNWRAPIMADAIIKTFDPESVVDVGCATGDIISALQKEGIIACGIEGSDQVIEHLEVKRECIWITDIRLPLKFPLQLPLPSSSFYDNWFSWANPHTNIPPFDLVMSLEVAEHIESEYADQYLDNLCSLGDKILITAAPPGQGGHYHVNCQPREYWRDKFYDRGFLPAINREEYFKRSIKDWKHKKGIKAYYYNSMVFYKKIF